MKYWQVAAGSYSRDYSQYFLQYGMAFVGGDDNRKAIKKVQPDDKIILKRGMGEIVAVGRVIERYGKSNGDAIEENDKKKEWLLDFDGWDLPGYCYVEWHKLAEPLKVKGLTRTTIESIDLPHIKKHADEILFTTPIYPSDPEEPPMVEDLDFREMLSYLINLGLRPSIAEDLTMTINRISLLAQYYSKNCNSDDVREHETRTFLIVPLLLALGWSEQQIKIELGVSHGRVDVACFARAYHRDKGIANNDECVLILESKGFSQGLYYAHEQGKRYAAFFQSCKVVVASNGYCYKAYDRKKGGNDFEQEPSAYLNLLLPKKKYMLNPESVDGGLKILKYLLPQTWLSIKSDKS